MPSVTNLAMRPHFLETANDQAGLSDKMDEARAETGSETGDEVAGQETQS